jgi:hypothetical protein
MAGHVGRAIVPPAVLLLTFVTLQGAQSFEVASIKPNRTGSEDSGNNTSHGRLTATNNSLKELIQRAFNVKDF